MRIDKKNRRGVLVCGLMLAVGGLLFGFIWQHGAPRRSSLKALTSLNASLNSSDASGLLQAVVMPAALQQRTDPEQIEFLKKALRDEISSSGVEALKRNGAFGALQTIFPEDADRWAKQASVEVNQCVAFRMERGGIRAEVVLFAKDGSYRIIRCNNVKQMAAQG